LEFYNEATFSFFFIASPLDIGSYPFLACFFSFLVVALRCRCVLRLLALAVDGGVVVHELFKALDFVSASGQTFACSFVNVPGVLLDTIVSGCLSAWLQSGC